MAVAGSIIMAGSFCHKLRCEGVAWTHTENVGMMDVYLSDNDKEEWWGWRQEGEKRGIDKPQAEYWWFWQRAHGDTWASIVKFLHFGTQFQTGLSKVSWNAIRWIIDKLSLLLLLVSNPIFWCASENIVAVLQQPLYQYEQYISNTGKTLVECRPRVSKCWNSARELDFSTCTHLVFFF